ncbi:Adaptin N terminal region [Haloarchaeobius iranensis]|uniref:Adaptin N terminal region n=2 Tax=Haloarchaeobius iranensis TaxID=996166 RepID=A0A1H0BP28_9EURY|nr:Adaptin N terminal region [Haloarchaeobius iranensis]
MTEDSSNDPDDEARRAEELRTTVEPTTVTDETIDELCALLDGRHGRSDAHAALSKISTHPDCARRVAVALQPYLVHETRRTREEALDMLAWTARTDPDALETTVEWLFGHLDTEDEHVRATAVTALERLAEAEALILRSHVDELVDFLDDDALRADAVSLLATISHAYPEEIAPASDELLALSADETVDASAIPSPLGTVALVRPDIVDAVIELLRAELAAAERDPERIGIASTLGTIAVAYPEEAPMVVAELLSLAEGEPDERDADIDRGVVLSFVGSIGVAHPETVVPELSRLTALLDDDNRLVRSSAVEALGNIATVRPAAVRPALDDIVARFDGASEDLQFDVVTALGKVAAADPEAAPRIVATLDEWFDDDTADDGAAGGDAADQGLFGLAGSGQDAIGATHDDNQWQLQQEILRAYARIGAGSPDVLDPVMDDIRASLADENLSSEAAEALGAVGGARPDSVAPAVAGLHELLAEGPYWGRRAAASALGKVGAADPEVADLVVDDLQRRLADGNYAVRAAAAEALGRIATADPDVSARVRDEIQPLVDDDEPDVRSAALDAFGQLAAADRDTAERVVEDLQAGLSDVDPHVRSSAAKGLGTVGAAHPRLTATAVEALESRFECDEEYLSVRASIAEALRALAGTHSDTVTVSDAELQRVVDADVNLVVE